MIKILIVDDSAVIREYLSYLFSSEPDFQVIGIACNGKEAVEMNKEKLPDIVIMDVNMPVMDGFEATRRIMETRAIPVLIISATCDPTEIGTSFRAMEAGALMILEKPTGISHAGYEKTVGELLRLARLMAEVKVVTRRTTKSEKKEPDRSHELQLRELEPDHFELVTIGTSTGGPVVLQRILSQLPAQFPIPILIVQHISQGFLAGMVEWLDQITPLKVRIAQNAERLLPGNVYLAPEGFQVGIVKNHDLMIRLTRDFSNPSFCPSVAEMFRSVTNTLAPNIIGILLTGMGDDGARELKKMRDLGGVTIAQNEESCIVYGMPKVAVESGAAKYILNPDEIAASLTNLMRTSKMRK
ncbi:MAG: chemotaxis-specific protein-glutamate methyltransferase CheB [Candidatus Marinimicrobia bacterium]|nr:chemotaxis-specific protein-glutamate methyltransferase CheB [Candidatus Neomarinimicrobiota bacterium]